MGYETGDMSLKLQYLLKYLLKKIFYFAHGRENSYDNRSNGTAVRERHIPVFSFPSL